jgi:hypothetical protein
MMHRIQAIKQFQDYAGYLATIRVALLLVAAATPSLFIIYLIARYGVDIPFADEWTLAPLLLKAHNHTLGLADLFAQHNEHRLVFPRLLMIGIARATHGNLRAEMFFSVALAIGTAFNVGWILRRSFAREPAKLFFLIVLANLLLFSPVQAENWIWGFQFCLFLITFLLTSGVCIATSQLAMPTKFLACFTIAFIATFSFGNGALLWLVTFPIALFVTEKPTSRRNLPWLFAWIAGAACTISLYAFHYVKPAHHPALAASRHLIDYYFYVAGFLGANLAAPLGRKESMALPVLLGTLLSGIYFLALIGIRGDRKFLVWKEAAPWLAIAAFAMTSSGIAAVTRIGFGVTQALDSRYTTFSLLFAVALIALVAISDRELRATFSERRRILDWVSRVEGACLILFAITFFISAGWGTEQIRAIQRTRLWGKGALHFATVLNDQPIYQMYLGGYGPDVLRFAKMENSIGYLHPSMCESAIIAHVSSPVVPSPQIGFIDRLIPSKETCIAQGWAVLPRSSRVADCVVMAAQSQNGRRFAFAVNDQVEDRPDVIKVINRRDLLRCGWRTQFGRSSIPTGEYQITAWAVDANSGLLYQLGGEMVLR